MLRRKGAQSTVRLCRSGRRLPCSRTGSRETSCGLGSWTLWDQQAGCWTRTSGSEGRNEKEKAYHVVDRKLGRSRSILFRRNSNDHVVHDSHREHGISFCEVVTISKPMIVNMFSDQIHTTRSTDVEIRLAVVLLLE